MRCKCACMIPTHEHQSGSYRWKVWPCVSASPLPPSSLFVRHGAGELKKPLSASDEIHGFSVASRFPHVYISIPESLWWASHQSPISHSASMAQNNTCHGTLRSTRGSWTERRDGLAYCPELRVQRLGCKNHNPYGARHYHYCVDHPAHLSSIFLLRSVVACQGYHLHLS
jgi:hypothetical protein